MSPAQILQGTRAVDAITLHPEEIAFREIRGRLSPFGGGSVSRTFLVQAFGTSPGYDADTALERGARELNLLCALLSLAGGRLWVVRESPQTSRHVDGTPHAKPLDFPATPGRQEFLVQNSGPFPDPVTLQVDSWIDQAWTTLQENAELARLLLAYGESLILAMDGHESYSLLAAVGIIESLGKGPELPKCPSCGLITGATSRFRDTLMRVMDESRARRLAKAYEQRSTTAHDAVLHGMEPFAGIKTMRRLFSATAHEKFEGIVREMQHATATLLWQELHKGPLDPSQ